MTTVDLDPAPSTRTPLRAAGHAAAFTAAVSRPSLIRRWSRKVVQSTPPPLPLISLPPDDEWEEFDVPTKTGFGYSLPHVSLPDEETEDTSSATTRLPTQPNARHDRAGICRLLSDYMAQNEVFQVKRHRFGIDTKLVYKRNKAATTSTTSKATVDIQEDDLVFDALFESGNLDRAYRVLGRHYASTQELLSASANDRNPPPSQSTQSWGTPFPFFAKADLEYDLYCDPDISTHGHIQWYFFRVTVPPQAQSRTTPSPSSTVLRVRFNIRNMLKKSSLYNDGMLPAVYIEGVRGWHHAGTNVCYFKNAETYRHRKTGKATNFYTLSFVYEFQLPEVEAGPETSPPPLRVYFAHTYPYTYTTLQQYLMQLQKDPERNRFFRRRVLCKTIAGNICDVLTITDFGHEDDDRTAVVLTARVHPGESNASFIMHGIIDYLTSQSVEARYLRHRFVFKVVPMLNPDGVIHGNYRCSLAGTDLNRRYISPSPELHPTVFACKNMVMSLSKTRTISLYCDIHGHSRKKNMFLYGCVPFEGNSRSEAAKLRLFPHVLCKTCASHNGGYFCFQDCTFSVSKSKKGTGRVVVWDEARVLNSFTLEASFFGVGDNRSNKRATMGPQSAGSNQQQPDPNRLERDAAIGHFMPRDLRLAGAKFCHSLIPFAHLLDRDRPQPRVPPLVSSVDDSNPTLSTSPSPEIRAQFLRSHTSVGFNTTSTRDMSLPGNGQNGNVQWISECKPRLAPLDNPSSPISPSSVRPVNLVSPSASFDSPSTSDFFSFDGVFASLSSPEDLLKEIEDTLPENFGSCGDSDDEGESAGSESDPSGDNMEDEELERQDSWSSLIPPVEIPSQELNRPKLLKNRSQTLLKRFSDSLLAINAMMEQQSQVVIEVDPLVQTIPPPEPEPVVPDPLQIAPALTTPKPTVTLAPVRTRAQLPTHISRRRPSEVNQLLQYQDRNREIASLHLRAVQRRTRTRR